MADRYYVGGSGNLSDTAHWSTISGGAGGASVPGSGDRAIFDDNSAAATFTVTVNAAVTTGDFDASGITLTARKMTLGFTSGSGNLQVTGNFTVPGSTLFATTGSSSALTFAPSGAGKTIITNGQAFGSLGIVINGPSGGVVLGGAFSTTGAVTLTAGSFSTAGFSFTANSFLSNGSTTRAADFSGSTVTPTNTWSVAATGLTLTLTGATLIMTGTGVQFTGGGFTYPSLSFTNGNTTGGTINDANTFGNLIVATPGASAIHFLVLGGNITVTGTLTLGASNAPTSRVQVQSNTAGTARSITLNGALAALSDVDFRDITAAGSVATPWTGTRLGDLQGNSGVTFPAPKTVYRNLAGSNNWSATAWAATSGGAPAAANFPLAQDTAIIDNSSADTTISMDTSWNIGSLDMSARTSALAFNTTSPGDPTFYGIVALSTSITVGQAGAVTWTFGARSGTQTLDPAGRTIPARIFAGLSGVNGAGFKLLGALTCLKNSTNGSFFHLGGALDLNGFSFTGAQFASNNATVRSIRTGGGTLNVGYLDAGAADVFTTGTSTNLTVLDQIVVNVMTAGSGASSFRVVTGSLGEGLVPDVNILDGSLPFTTSGAVRHLNFNPAGGSYSGTLNNATRTIYGDLTLKTGMTTQAGTLVTTFGATSGVQHITTAGLTLDFPITDGGASPSELRLMDALTMGSTRTLTHSSGFLNLNGFDLTAGLVDSNNSGTRSITAGGGRFVLPNNNATVVNIVTLTGLTINDRLTFRLTYSGSVGSRTVSLGAFSEAASVNVTVTAGTDILSTANNISYKDLDLSGFAGTFLASSRNIYGDLTVGASVSWTASANVMGFLATSGTQNITTNGVIIDMPVTVNAPGATVKLLGALTVGSTRITTLSAGTLNLNGFNFATGTYSSSGGTAKGLAFGTSALAITGSGGSAFFASGSLTVTYSAGAKVSMTSASAKTASFGGGSWPALEQGGAGTLTVGGANTFAGIQWSSGGAGATITLPTASTTSLSSGGAITGQASSRGTLNSSAPGTRALLRGPSGMVVNCSHVNFTDIDAGIAIFRAYAANDNVNTSNNVGLLFQNETLNAAAML